jgi:hypothetical protein
LHLVKQQNIKTGTYMNNNSLPIGHEKLEKRKPYINLSKLPDGEYRFRIVERPIAGWVDWMGNKPCRFRPEDEPKSSFDPTKPVRRFWALHVWSYENEGLFIMEITQSTIIGSLKNFANNSDWGDITSFDIKIKKEGALKNTKYTVSPVPHKPMSDAIKKEVTRTKVRLEALYEGKDPWTDLEPSASVITPLSDRLTEDQVKRLSEVLISFPSERSSDFICNRLGVNDIFQVPQEKYNGVLQYLEKESAKFNEESEYDQQLA